MMTLCISLGRHITGVGHDDYIGLKIVINRHHALISNTCGRYADYSAHTHVFSTIPFSLFSHVFYKIIVISTISSWNCLMMTIYDGFYPQQSSWSNR